MDFLGKAAKHALVNKDLSNQIMNKVGGLMNNFGSNQGGYPPNQGGYPPNQGGYPPNQGGYPPQQPGYPPQQPGYPPQQPGYPPQQPGYPPQQSGYPPQQSGYPPQQPGYPPQQPGYPPQQSGYPPSQGYPSNPGYPPQSGYPPNPAQPGPYPSSSSPYPPMPSAGSGAYPPAPGSTPYPPAPGASAFPPAPGTPGYPPAPSYSQPPGAPGYPPAPGAPSYPPVPGAPSYSQASSAPSYSQASSAPSYSPAPEAPSTASTAYSSQSMRSQSQRTNYSYTEMPTVKPAALFDPSNDASLLRKAMKGFGTDEKAIIAILARRTSDQRQQIMQRYTQSYGKDLVKDLKSELSGKFEQVILAMMTPLPQFLAREIHDAIAGIGTNERTLVEILCTRDNRSLNEIKAAYQYLYKKPIQEDIRGDTSGDFKRLLISVTTAFREEGPCNPELAPGIAQQLYKAGEGKLGTNEGEFNRILATYSFELLRCVFAEYQKIKGKTFGQAIDSELSGDLKLGMKAIYMAIENRAAYFAKEIHDSMAGLGTNDKALIRLIVSRAEIDMVNIKQEYQKIYKNTLEKDIQGDVSGDYKNILISLVEE